MNNKGTVRLETDRLVLKGYTTEALKEVMKYLINDVGIKKFRCSHAKLNPASGAVM